MVRKLNIIATLTLLLLVLSGTETYAKKIKFGKVSKEELSSSISNIDSTANAEFIYKYKYVYFSYVPQRGVVVNEVTHERIKIYNKEGFDYANKVITYYSPEASRSKKDVGVIKGYTYNLVDGKIQREKLKDSSIFKERKNKYYNTKKISFPKVKEGSIVEYKYQIQSDFISISDIVFEEEIPIKEFIATVQIPEYYKFHLRNKGYHQISPIKESANGQFQSLTQNNGQPLSFQQDVFEFKANNIKGYDQNEPYSGNVNPYIGKGIFELSGIDFPGAIYEDFSNSWDAVCKQVSKDYNFTNELEKKDYYKKELATIIASEKDDTQKLISIFNYVKNNVSWNNFYGVFTNRGVRHAFKNHQGNCSEINLMLTSMLRSAGLKANPVLLSTKSHGSPLFPTLDGYNYVISVVHLGNNNILLDATDKYAQPNLLPERCINWKGFEILPNKTFNWINLVPNTYASSNFNLFLNLDDKGGIKGKLRRSFINHKAIDHIKENENKSEDKIITSIENKYNVDIKDYSKKPSSVFNTTIDVLSFSTSNFCSRKNNEIAISPLCFLKQRSNPFKAETRHFPIDFVLPQSQKSVISITIPEGYKVKYIPKSKIIRLPENLGSYNYKIKNTGFAISLIAEIKINTNIFGPNYYNDLKAFFDNIAKQEIERIVFTKA
ncbi:DUF3857 and transglutaminase domain-containing protein [Halosquirtibacter xylanolyticus]|uniref:DUF3857 domain-containing protein n=1 Tax=Halosquirtibacter xylanolyticus TaxID=3374599 RepID=UPI0037484190|nr:DUF3857 and transglutaminase domain-containing protein [Prolixibacteraceae bacterium]